MMTPATYLVEIHYREPSYEAWHGRRERPYRWRYRLEASSERDAIDAALAEFRLIERQSWAGWTREVVAVEAARSIILEAC
jgi:hypothetical protein